VFEGGSVKQRYFLGGGFVEVTNARCTILAEGAVAVEDIDRAEVEQQIRDLRDDVGAATTDLERAIAEANLKVAEAKLQALDAPSYAGGH
jgi:F-type H+-transporting ATPase subunit epsilon